MYLGNIPQTVAKLPWCYIYLVGIWEPFKITSPLFADYHYCFWAGWLVGWFCFFLTTDFLAQAQYF